MSSRKGGSRKRSWVWSYFEEAEAEVGQKGRCLVEINNNTCGHMTVKRTNLKPNLFEQMLWLKRNVEYLGVMFPHNEN